jgi:hypothetical protein
VSRSCRRRRRERRELVAAALARAQAFGEATQSFIRAKTRIATELPDDKLDIDVIRAASSIQGRGERGEGPRDGCVNEGGIQLAVLGEATPGAERVDGNGGGAQGRSGAGSEQPVRTLESDEAPADRRFRLTDDVGELAKALEGKPQACRRGRQRLLKPKPGRLASASTVGENARDKPAVGLLFQHPNDL